MIAFVCLDHVGVRVRDFNRAVPFYRELGFRVTRDDPLERVVVLRHPSGLVLNLLDSAPDAGADHNVLMDEPSGYAGYTHIALAVEDIHRAAGELEAKGIAITEGPVTFGDRSISVFFRDVDRNVIELTQPATDHQPT